MSKMTKALFVLWCVIAATAVYSYNPKVFDQQSHGIKLFPDGITGPLYDQLTQMIMVQDGTVRLLPKTVAPTCDTPARGTYYFDDNLGWACACNGSAWCWAHSPTTCDSSSSCGTTSTSTSTSSTTTTSTSSTTTTSTSTSSTSTSSTTTTSTTTSTSSTSTSTSTSSTTSTT